MSFTRLAQLVEAVAGLPRKRLVAAYVHDAHTVEAVADALRHGIADATLVGEPDTVARLCTEHGVDLASVTIVAEADETAAAHRAVELVNAGEAQFIMKGTVSTDRYKRAILHKERGLMNPGGTLSHVAVVESPEYPKLFAIADGAIIPEPDLKQKILIANNLIAVARALGVDRPKIAVLAATEQVLPGNVACAEAAVLSKMAERGQIKHAIVDGPLSLDVALDREAAATKGVASPVAGDADGLLFPNIESGNVFYKTATKLGRCETASMVVGARVPCVLCSRGDTAKTKLYSIALAALTSKN